MIAAALGALIFSNILILNLNTSCLVSVSAGPGIKINQANRLTEDAPSWINNIGDLDRVAIYIKNETSLMMRVSVCRERVIHTTNEIEHSTPINTLVCEWKGLVYFFQANSCPIPPFCIGRGICLLREECWADSKRSLSYLRAPNLLLFVGISSASDNEPSVPRNVNGGGVSYIFDIDPNTKNRTILAEIDPKILFYGDSGGKPSPLTDYDRLARDFGLGCHFPQLILHNIQLSVGYAGLPSGYAGVGEHGHNAGEIDQKHWRVFGAPAASLFGILALSWGWWLLWNCSGWWPQDRNRIAIGILLFLTGVAMFHWGFFHVIKTLNLL